MIKKEFKQQEAANSYKGKNIFLINQTPVKID